ncbi:MAG: peptidylprolyl isomerase [Actinomycetota bacterium]|nr:peptidylprolyl isomerase [Actinomycetota bacterium]
MRRAPVLIPILAGALALGACGKDSGPGDGKAADAPKRTQTATTPKPVVTPRRTKDGCAPVAEAQPREEQRKRSRRKLNRRKRYVATLRTNCGTIQIKLDVKNFPKTTRSFAGLARGRFYDGLSFHRIAKPGGNNFVIQGGDPLGSGEGGPGYKVVEPPRRSQGYPVGTVAMAKATDEKRGTSGSQFFIVTGQGAVLDPVYAVVGRVIGAGRAVRRIAAVPADPVTEMPIDPVIIKRVTIRGSKA